MPAKSNSAAAVDPFIDRLLLRSPLKPEERTAILGLPGEEVVTPAHRDIVRPGQDTTFACLVVSGIAGRFDQLANGHRQTTALHIPGDMCDLHSVAAPQTGWGIVSLTETTIRQIPHQALCDLVETYPRVAFAFWRDTVVDASILAKWLSVLGRRGAKAGLAHLMCEMGIRFQLAGLGSETSFRLPTTQSQLADVLGVTPVHLNRTMQALRQEGLLVTDGVTFQIPDLPRLRKMAQFDDAYLLLNKAGH